MHLNMHVHTIINKCNNENKKYKIVGDVLDSLN